MISEVWPISVGAQDNFFRKWEMNGFHVNLEGGVMSLFVNGLLLFFPSTKVLIWKWDIYLTLATLPDWLSPTPSGIYYWSDKPAIYSVRIKGEVYWSYTRSHSLASRRKWTSEQPFLFFFSLNDMSPREQSEADYSCSHKHTAGHYEGTDTCD